MQVTLNAWRDRRPANTGWRGRVHGGYQVVAGVSSAKRLRMRVSMSSLTGADLVGRCRRVRFPVEIALARLDGASVAAAHGNDDVSCTDDLDGPRLGALAGDVDAALGH